MLPPNPCLVAVLLIIKTRAGPRHVFHYPPRPGQNNPHIKFDYEGSSDEDSTASSDGDGDYSSLDDDRSLNGGDANSTERGGQEPDIDESGSASPEKDDGTRWKKANSGQNGFLGLPYGLYQLLCPAATFHKKKFEMSIDGLVFLGWPVFSRENGAWHRRKRPKGTRSTDTSAGKTASVTEQELGKPQMRTSLQIDEDLGETSGLDTGVEDQPNVNREATNEDNEDYQAQAEEYTRSKDMVEMGMKEILNMFHVVFILDPPPLEYNLRVKGMYDHIVKKFSRALKWEQTRSNYVLKEAEVIRQLEIKNGRSSHLNCPSTKTCAHTPELPHIKSFLNRALQERLRHYTTVSLPHVSPTLT